MSIVLLVMLVVVLLSLEMLNEYVPTILANTLAKQKAMMDTTKIVKTVADFFDILIT